MRGTKKVDHLPCRGTVIDFIEQEPTLVFRSHLSRGRKTIGFTKNTMVCGAGSKDSWAPYLSARVQEREKCDLRSGARAKG